MQARTLAVIGAGPKAAALAAKASVLNALGLANIRLTIFERYSVGAAWSGQHGYTDGQQALCTPAERDLGHPYQDILGGTEAASAMLAEYSWAAYQTSIGAYAAWVDRNRDPPLHTEFAAYLAWALDKAGHLTVFDEVIQISKARKKWRLATKAGTHRRLFDGVVVTGPGEALRVRATATSSRVIDGVEYWLNPGIVGKLLKSGDPSARHIVIIGAGGTAAAITASLVRSGLQDEKFTIIAEQATLFSRVESFYENELFSDEARWLHLSPESRRSFSDRLTRGVVWGNVIEDLKPARGIEFFEGRATLVEPHARTVTVHMNSWKGPKFTVGSVVIDASGFNRWWFLDLLQQDERDRLPDNAALEKSIGQDLSFSHPYWLLPRLHAPSAAVLQGAGFPNLMALGGMADRILRPYLP